MTSAPDVLAAGGVLWRGEPSDPEVALVHRPAYDDWSLPKGKRHDDEQLVVAARREVAEETGQLALIGSPLPSQDYPVHQSHGWLSKHVRCWTLHDGSGEFSPGPEVDAVRWLGVPEARESLTAPRDVDTLDGVTASALTATTVLLIARLPRPAGRPGPLPEHAHRLAELAHCFGPRRVLTPEQPGCLRTALPLGERLGTTVEVTPVLHRRAQPGLADAAVRRVRELAVGGGGAVCVAVPVARALLRDLMAMDGLGRPHGEPAKGDAWALRMYRGRLLSVERFRPTRVTALPHAVAPPDGTTPWQSAPPCRPIAT